MYFEDDESLRSVALCAGAWEPGGSGGVGPPLESGIYVVKIFLKIFLIYIFGPPLDKNRSQAPVHFGPVFFSFQL